MAEEVIFCPSCNHKLRVPEELLGQVVQCPMCRLVFTTPTRGAQPIPSVLPVPPAPIGDLAAVPPPPPAPSDFPVHRAAPPVPQGTDAEEAHEGALLLIRPPATLLLLLGVVGWIANAFNALRIKFSGVEGIARELEQQQQLLEQWGLGASAHGMTPEFVYRTSLIMHVGLLLLCTGVIAGATQMLRQRGYWFAVLGSLLAMGNLTMCCCVLGLPVGIWSLVVLSRPEVRRAFE